MLAIKSRGRLMRVTCRVPVLKEEGLGGTCLQALSYRATVITPFILNLEAQVGYTSFPSGYHADII